MESFIEVLNLLIYTFIAALISLLLSFVNFALIFKNDYMEKTSTYECGFQPFDKVTVNFEVKYYLVALLFLLFDLELIFLLPWISCFNNLDTFAFTSMLFFIFILLVGFYYEWKRGSLDWN